MIVWIFFDKFVFLFTCLKLQSISLEDVETTCPRNVYQFRLNNHFRIIVFNMSCRHNSSARSYAGRTEEVFKPHKNIDISRTKRRR